MVYDSKGCWSIIGLIIGFILLMCAKASADENQQTNFEGCLSAGIGMEILHYAEDESDMNVKSHSTSINLVYQVIGEKRLRNLSVWVKGTAPVLVGRDTEKWTRRGIDAQSNDLQYAWYRFDGRVGYVFKPWLIPYTGVRWSETVQERDHFVVNDTRIPGCATEKVYAYELPAGFRGKVSINHNFNVSYDVCFYMQLHNKVKNTNFPDITIRDIDTYGIDAGLRAIYRLSKRFEIGCHCQLGQVHRDDSQWVDAGDGSTKTKYPENDTISLMFAVSSQWRF